MQGFPFWRENGGRGGFHHPKIFRKVSPSSPHICRKILNSFFKKAFLMVDASNLYHTTANFSIKNF